MLSQGPRNFVVLPHMYAKTRGSSLQEARNDTTFAPHCRTWFSHARGEVSGHATRFRGDRAAPSADPELGNDAGARSSRHGTLGRRAAAAGVEALVIAGPHGVRVDGAISLADYRAAMSQCDGLLGVASMWRPRRGIPQMMRIAKTTPHRLLRPVRRPTPEILVRDDRE